MTENACALLLAGASMYGAEGLKVRRDVGRGRLGEELQGMTIRQPSNGRRSLLSATGSWWSQAPYRCGMQRGAGSANAAYSQQHLLAAVCNPLQRVTRRPGGWLPAVRPRTVQDEALQKPQLQVVTASSNFDSVDLKVRAAGGLLRWVGGCRGRVRGVSA